MHSLSVAASSVLTCSTRSRRPRRGAFCSVVLALAAASTGLAAAPPAGGGGTAPARTATAESAGWWASVTTNDVYVRSAPSVDSSYPFLKLDRGALVKVVEETVGWARVPALGPSFKEAFGYVRADRKVKLSADGKRAEIVSKADVLAPNLSARFNPDSSWKPIAKLEPGQIVPVLDVIEGQRDTVYKIALPASSDGWINLTFLRKATAEELATLGPALSGVPAAPEATPGQTPNGAPIQPPTQTPTQTPSQTPTPNDAGAGASSGSPPVPTTSGGANPADGTTAPSNPQLSPTTPARAGEPESPPPASAPGGFSETPPASGTTPPVGDAATTPPADNATITTGDATTPPVESNAARVRRITIDDIEQAFEAVQRENPETAEVGPLRERYLEFADRPDTSASQREFARARAEQLQIKIDIQTRLAKVREMRAKANADLDTIRGARVAMDARREYVAVGRLNASTIYDGQRLPLLFRIQDPSGGQSIGYLQPGQGFDLTALLGQLVGVVGTQGYDSALRLNIVTPTRIDLLTTAP